MKHCFVINPAAGSGKDQDTLLPRIMNAAKQWSADYEIHRTSGPGEAISYVRGRIETNEDDRIRFYACGGDGTASEILNGMYGAPETELAIIPAGSGNDYVRNFGDRDCFCDILALLAGEAVPVDVMEYSFTPLQKGDPETKTSYALNMINIGFDARVVRRMERLKNKLFLKGTGAYVAGVVLELAGYKMSKVVFRPEGYDDFETDILLAGVGSGRFSGGGFDGIPVAEVNDGLLDLMFIKPLTRRKFIKLVGAYHDGKHVGNPELENLLFLFRTTKVEIEPAESLIFTADGEVNFTAKTVIVSIAPEKVNFVIPDGVKMP